jgi:hypothetical protein
MIFSEPSAMLTLAGIPEKPIDEAIRLDLKPLLNGFMVSLRPGPRGWFTTYQARKIYLNFSLQSDPESVEQREIYEVSDTQNLTLQKTIFGLSEGETYLVSYELRDDANLLVAVSLPEAIQTLNLEDALGIIYNATGE